MYVCVMYIHALIDDVGHPVGKQLDRREASTVLLPQRRQGIPEAALDNVSPVSQGE